MGWQRIRRWCETCAQLCRRVEYIGLTGARWQRLEIPYTDRVRLDQLPAGFDYLEGEGDSHGG